LDLGVYFLVKNSLPPDPTLRQTNPVQAIPAYKFKINLAYLAIYVSVFFLSCYPTKSPHALLFFPESVRCPEHLILDDFMTLILVLVGSASTF
jgi:hypothetical protein